MASKFYKSKLVEPLVKRLKNLVKSVLVRYYEMKSTLSRWQNANINLANERDNLHNTVENLRERNTHLEDIMQDYKLLRKVIGRKQV